MQSALTQAQQYGQQTHQLSVQLGSQLATQTRDPATTTREAKIPDPDKFDGKRDDLRAFLAQLRLKLVEPGAFRNEQAKLRYAVSRLKGIALEQIISYITPTKIDFDTVDDLIDHLNASFDEPDRAASAARHLQTIKQGNKDFSTYFAEFRRYSQQVDWNQSAIRSALKNGLSIELENALITMDEPDDYNKFIQLLTKVDTKMRAARQKQVKPTPTPKSYNNGYIKPNPGSSTGATPSPKAPVPNPTASNSGNYGPAPMDISSSRRRLTPEERTRRITQGLCLYCGGAGHIASLCPNRGKGQLVASEAFLKITEEVPNHITPGINNEASDATESKN